MMGCRTDERLSEGLPLTQDTIPDRPQALVSPEAEKKVVNPKTALLYQYLAIRMLERPVGDTSKLLQHSDRKILV